MKKHLKTHSFRYVQYKCNFCNYYAEDDIGIAVHVGKDHGENFECGLCEFVAKDLEALEIHLCTCEIYKCEKLWRRFYKLKRPENAFL